MLPSRYPNEKSSFLIGSINISNRHVRTLRKHRQTGGHATGEPTRSRGCLTDYPNAPAGKDAAMADQPPIPDTLADIDADWIRRALAAGGLRDLPPLETASTRRLRDWSGALAEVGRCRLRLARASPGLPGSLIVKLPSPWSAYRRACRVFSLYRREADYYRRLAGQRAVASPRLYYGDFEPRGHRFVLVLEDLGHMRMVPQLTGCDESQAMLAVKSIAGLHAKYWNRTDKPPVHGMFDATGRGYRTLNQLYYLACLPTAAARLQNVVDGESLKIIEAYGARLAAHHSEFTAGVKTFIHGDFRSENMFFDRGAAGGCSVIDWQTSGIGGALYDVACFLSGSVPRSVRRRIERAALREYHESLCRAGVRGFPFEACWNRYRQAMLATLLPVVGAWGTMDIANKGLVETVTTTARRTLSAIGDLGSAEYLPGTGRLPDKIVAAASSGLYRLMKSATAARRGMPRT